MTLSKLRWQKSDGFSLLFSFFIFQAHIYMFFFQIIFIMVYYIEYSSIDFCVHFCANTILFWLL